MAEITLTAEVGRTIGSSSTRRLRTEGKIPGVIYGHGTEPLPVAVVGKELRLALSGEAGTNALLSLDTGDQTYLALARELQRHPVKGTVIHVDFQIVRRDEVISADVPLSLVGEALAVQHADGLVEQQLFSLPVHAKPADIPNAIVVDITNLVIGEAIRVGDLELPPGVSIDLPEDVAIVAGQTGRVAVEAEGEEVEEGEAGAAAPATGDSEE